MIWHRTVPPSGLWLCEDASTGQRLQQHDPQLTAMLRYLSPFFAPSGCFAPCATSFYGGSSFLVELRVSAESTPTGRVGRGATSPHVVQARRRAWRPSWTLPRFCTFALTAIGPSSFNAGCVNSSTMGTVCHTIDEEESVLELKRWLLAWGLPEVQVDAQCRAIHFPGAFTAVTSGPSVIAEPPVLLEPPAEGSKASRRLQALLVTDAGLLSCTFA